MLERSRRWWLVLPAATLLALAGCAFWDPSSFEDEPPSFEDLPPADELYEQGLERLAEGRLLWVIPRVDYDGAIETFQTVIDNYPYSEQAVLAELKIADAYFDDGRYDEALAYYRDFADLHPQNDRVPYTILRSALCYHEQVGSIERDQSSAFEALAYLERLVRDHPYAPETREGEVVLRGLRERLARSVVDKGDFYMNRGEHQAAAERFRQVLNLYPGLGMDAEALYKLGVCYSKMERHDEAMRLFHVILENFRDSDLAESARERVAAVN